MHRASFFALLLAASPACSLMTGLEGLGAGSETTPPIETAENEASMCAADDECPAPEYACQRPDCALGGVCATAPLPEGTLLPSPAGDCARRVCDAHGAAVDEADEDDPFDDGNGCTLERCDGSLALLEKRDAGEPCSDGGGHVCDGDGHCVACAHDGDCPGQVCQSHLCVPIDCQDGMLGGAETDVDCGGPCAPCSAGLACASGSDCKSGACEGGTCMPPSCDDGIENGAETDLDCGAGCGPCGVGQGCAQRADCLSHVCIGGTCAAPTCTDAVLNGHETGIDCGGPSCPDCLAGAPCLGDDDCVSKVCGGPPATASCQPASCNDGVKNGGEAGIDCGAAGCPPCAISGTLGGHG